MVSTVYVPAGCTPSTSVSEKGREKVIVVKVVRSGMDHRSVLAHRAVLRCMVDLCQLRRKRKSKIGPASAKTMTATSTLGVLLPTITAAIKAMTIAKTVVRATATAASYQRRRVLTTTEVLRFVPTNALGKMQDARRRACGRSVFRGDLLLD